MDFSFVIQAVSIFQFLIVSVFLINNKKGKRISNNLFALFLIAKSVCYAGALMVYDNYCLFHLPFVYILTTSVDLILGPALNLYVLSLIYKDFRLKTLQILHLLPFILYIIIFTILFLTYPGGGLSLLFSNHPLVFILFSLTYVHFLIYSILCLKKLREYENNLKNGFSSIEKLKMAWLFFLTAGFVAIWFTAFTDFIIENFAAKTIIPWELFIILIFIFSNIIVYKGLKQPELFAGINEDNEKNPVQKYAKTAINEEKKQELLDQIIDYMKINKPYLNPSITLDEFAEKLCIPAYCISQVLNTNLNQNFFDFINSYRIEESKINLQANPGHTILQVLYDAGFNSKASFNRAFKKFTGMTPSEYKKTYVIT